MINIHVTLNEYFGDYALERRQSGRHRQHGREQADSAPGYRRQVLIGAPSARGRLARSRRFRPLLRPALGAKQFVPLIDVPAELFVTIVNVVEPPLPFTA